MNGDLMARPIAVDAIIVSGGHVLLFRRKTRPFKNKWALPGGMVEDETTEAALIREVKEETNLDLKPLKLVGVYSKLDRDPRKTVSAAYLCKLKESNDKNKLKESIEGEGKWFPIYKALGMKLAFDHKTILIDGINSLVHYMMDEMIMAGLHRDAPVLHLKRKVSKFWRLIFIILSARTKDETTEKAINRLFDKYPNAEKLSKAPLKDIEKLIYGVGFYKVKAKHIKETASILAKQKIPETVEELIKLPGVGRKTANVFLAETGNANVGVDVHVNRISNRIGLVKTKKPYETEKSLNFLHSWEKEHINLAMVAYGQTICKPLNPQCKACKLKAFCMYGMSSKGDKDGKKKLQR